VTDGEVVVAGEVVDEVVVVVTIVVVDVVTLLELPPGLLATVVVSAGVVVVVVVVVWVSPNEKADKFKETIVTLLVPIVPLKTASEESLVQVTLQFELIKFQSLHLYNFKAEEFVTRL